MIKEEKMYKYIIILGLGLFLLGCKEQELSLKSRRYSACHTQNQIM